VLVASSSVNGDSFMCQFSNHDTGKNAFTMKPWINDNDPMQMQSTWYCQVRGTVLTENSTVGNKNDLNNNSSNNDSKEKEVVKESTENVIFICSKLTCVNFIKDLHKDECVED